MNVFYHILLLIFVFSCAKPNYTDGTDKDLSELSSDCKLYFSTENLCLSVSWKTIPTSDNTGSMTLTFYEKGDPDRIISPVNEPHLFLWMPSMGHGSSPVVMNLVSDGVYLASEIFFIMPGQWEMRYQLKNGSKIVEQVIQNITI